MLLLFLRKLAKTSSLIFICVRVRQVGFSFEDWKKLSVWSSALFKVFALEMRKSEAYSKKTRSNVSILLNKVFVLEHDRFMQVSHLFSWLFVDACAIICVKD